jgi:hypothetical protein
VTEASPVTSVVADGALKLPRRERFVKITGILGTGMPFPSRTFTLKARKEFVWAMDLTGSS